MAKTTNDDLDRVSGNIRSVILDFVQRRKKTGQRRFHMADLAGYVGEKGKCVAPDSAGRILRQLRRDGLLNYLVIDRSSSLYELKS